VSSDVVVVAGEALFDLVPSGFGDDLRGHAGGGPFNTARTIGRLGVPVAFLGRLSRDRFGRRLEDLLAADSVALDCVVRTDDPTTLAIAEVDRGGVARYRFYTCGTSAPGLTSEAALAALPERAGALHVGTLALALEPVASALEAVIDSLRGNALILVDPNCRPSAIDDRDAYRARLARVLSNSDVVKVSEEDVAWLEPDLTAVDGVRALLERGPAIGLLTRGPSGAVIVTRADITVVPAPPSKVVDTIGAGDAFGGAFLAWWHEHGLGAGELERVDLVAEATRFACMVAARTCARPGASPPHRSELERSSGTGSPA
jgi:fructokinase